MSVKMTALRPFAGAEGKISGGQGFETTEERAHVLESKNLARRGDPEKKQQSSPENKAVQPPQNKGTPISAPGLPRTSGPKAAPANATPKNPPEPPKTA